MPPFRHPSSVATSLAERSGRLVLSLAEGRELLSATNRKLLDLRERATVTLVRYSHIGTEDPLFSEPMTRFADEVGCLQIGGAFMIRR